MNLPFASIYTDGSADPGATFNPPTGSGGGGYNEVWEDGPSRCFVAVIFWSSFGTLTALAITFAILRGCRALLV